eukprot:gb/GECG01002810.1/.p1 GENE.gb/GECG01002810.1/~~gb/GECG01002810.1/.p1  ORF type:complete len:114 (+),score=4.19 gb/GECG01002810.1/:1-342(+)
MAPRAITAKHLSGKLREVADSKLVPFYSRFFKTAKGQYAEGDKFLGATRLYSVNRLVPHEAKYMYFSRLQVFEYHGSARSYLRKTSWNRCRSPKWINCSRRNTTRSGWEHSWC